MEDFLTQGKLRGQFFQFGFLLPVIFGTLITMSKITVYVEAVAVLVAVSQQLIICNEKDFTESANQFRNPFSSAS